MLFRSLLAPAFLAALTTASNLRGQEKQRNLQVPPTAFSELPALQENQVAFMMEEIRVTTSDDSRSSYQDDHIGFENESARWVEDKARDALEGQNTNLLSCQPHMIRASWVKDTATHTFDMRYICDFDDAMVVPNGNTFLEAFELEVNNNSGVNSLRQWLRNRLSSDNILHTATDVDFDGPFTALGASDGRLDGPEDFDDVFVLPFTITFFFQNATVAATDEELGHVAEASKIWIGQDYQQFFSYRFGSALKTVEAVQRSANFSMYEEVYEQEVTLDIQLLIAADTIVGVPTVNEYTSMMLRYSRATHFANILKAELPSNSTLLTSSQVSFTIKPSFQVSSLANYQARIDGNDTGEPAPEIPSSVSVGISLFGGGR